MFPYFKKHLLIAIVVSLLAGDSRFVFSEECFIKESVMSSKYPDSSFLKSLQCAVDKKGISPRGTVRAVSVFSADMWHRRAEHKRNARKGKQSAVSGSAKRGVGGSLALRCAGAIACLLPISAFAAPPTLDSGANMDIGGANIKDFELSAQAGPVRLSVCAVQVDSSKGLVKYLEENQRELQIVRMYLGEYQGQLFEFSPSELSAYSSYDPRVSCGNASYKLGEWNFTVGVSQQWLPQAGGSRDLERTLPTAAINYSVAGNNPENRLSATINADESSVRGTTYGQNRGTGISIEGNLDKDFDDVSVGGALSLDAQSPYKLRMIKAIWDLRMRELSSEEMEEVHRVFTEYVIAGGAEFTFSESDILFLGALRIDSTDILRTRFGPYIHISPAAHLKLVIETGMLVEMWQYAEFKSMLEFFLMLTQDDPWAILENKFGVGPYMILDVNKIFPQSKTQPALDGYAYIGRDPTRGQIFGEIGVKTEVSFRDANLGLNAYFGNSLGSGEFSPVPAEERTIGVRVSAGRAFKLHNAGDSTRPGEKSV